MATEFSWEEFYAAWLADYEDDSSLDTSWDSETTTSQTTDEDSTDEDSTDDTTTDDEPTDEEPTTSFSWDQSDAAGSTESEDDSSLDTSSTSNQTSFEDTSSDDTITDETTTDETTSGGGTLSFSAQSTSIVLASVQSGDGYYGANAITAGTTSSGEVTIDSGSYTVDRVHSGVPDYAAYAPTYGTVTITGAGTSVTAHSPDDPGSYGAIRAGYYNPGGTGLLYVSNGATLSSINEAYYANGNIYGGFHNFRVGVGYNSYGKLEMSGAGSSLTMEGLGANATVGGIDGNGRLEILAGASATFNASTVERPDGTVAGGYNNLDIGRDGGTGYALVSGPDSTLVTGGGAARIRVGYRDADGTLRIENGGFVGTFDIDVGRGAAGTTGTLIVDGPGSTFLASADYGYYGSKYAGAQGYLDIGRGSGAVGNLTVSNGGTFRTENVDGVTDFPFLRFARDNGSQGNGLVTGSGSTLEVVQIGQVDETNYFGTVGGAFLIVGDGGQGSLTVENGAQVNVLGDDATLVVADGRYTGGVPDTTTDQSQLLIQSGADVLVDSQNYGSYTSGGAERGAQVRIGGQRGTDGLVRVDGTGSTLTVTTDTDEVGDYQAAQITVGEVGRGQLDVTNGGAVFARELQIGNTAVTVDPGTGQTTAGSSGYLANADEAGYGIVNITGGADLTITGTDNTAYRGVRAGRASESTGIINVDGAGSTLTSEGGTGQIMVGVFGNGELNITNGGQVNGFFVRAGRSNGSDGRISVDGSGSSLTVSDAYGHFPGYGGTFLGEAGILQLGREANSYGYLGITAGGLVEVINDPGSGYDNPFVQLGRNYGAEGVVVIDGAGSELRVQQTGPQGDYYGTDGAGIAIGQGGQGDAEVRNGGTLQVLGSGASLNVSTGRDGVSSGPSELRVLSGATVNVDSQGYGGFQQFPDGDGGYVEEFIGARVVVGGAAATDGRILVDGAGSTLTVTSSAAPATDPAGVLIVGNEGIGQLDIANGGTVENLAANGATAIGKVAGSTGTASVTGAGSLLNAGALLLVGADFDNATAAPLPAAGGTGTLTLAGGGEAMASDIVVGATGTVGGDGTLTGDVALVGGTLTPGASPGTITITGDLTADADSTLLLEIDGFGAGEFDRVLVSGTADIDLAALDLQFPTSGTFAAGETATLVSSSDLTIASFTRDNFLTQHFGAVPAEGPTTLGGNLQGFLLADTGPDLIVRALGPDGANATGLVDFGAGVTDGVVVDTVNGFGTGTGGGFDAFALYGVSAILGTGGSDSISMATTSSVSIDGQGGDDALTAGAGDDLIDGGAGTDTLTGNAGADQFALVEGIETDTVTDFEDGTDMIAVAQGTSLSDISIVASGANDTEVLLASGDSLILLDTAPSQITDDDFVGIAAGSVIFGTEGDDTLTGTSGDDLIEGQGGDDTIDGKAGDDSLDGGDDTDEVFGDTGNDLIEGGNGPDLLIGSEGDDIINGGPGDDQMIGFAGADVFVFQDGSGNDIILDWEDGPDQLDFSSHSAANAIGDLTIAQDGADTVISFGSDSVRLAFVSASDIEASDLVF